MRSTPLRSPSHRSYHADSSQNCLSFNRILSGLCIFLFVSVSLNVMLLSRQSLLIHDDEIPEMDYTPFSPHANEMECDDLDESDGSNHPKQPSQILPNPVAVLNTNNDDVCHFNTSLRRRVYVYDIPSEWREHPRMLWYQRFVGLDNYNDSKSLNFGFGKKMFENDWSKRDIHFTHMHVLEIIWNERLKRDDYYITNNPDEAMLFHIPYPFALHYRFWERTQSERIAQHHQQLQEWLDNHPVYQKYFIDARNRRPHILTFGRIAYETVRLEKMGSKFWKINNGDMKKYWVLSIDRNCHGDPPSCWKRVSMPHPSNYHPSNVQSLKILVRHLKERMFENKKRIMVSFCGYIRTEHRNISRKTCEHFNRKSKYRFDKRYDKVCVVEDGERLTRDFRKNKLKVQHAFNDKCTKLYEDSVFCIQDGADSATRKGLWDGLIAGCIPVFLAGAMSDEFTCYGDTLHPWYVAAQKEFYVNQLLSLPTEYIKLLQMNLLRLIPKILYTNGNAGFSDAFDVIWHCLLRKTSLENPQFNPGCDLEYLVEHHSELYDFDKQLGYDKLYKYLEI